MKILVLGANGFLGSAIMRFISEKNLELIGVTISNYDQLVGTTADIVFDAASNSKKYLAEEQPVKEFDLSVAHRMRTIADFPAELHIHVSSIDVYNQLHSPEATTEQSIELGKSSNYGFHKFLAEQVVQHYAKRWFIFRLGGMVGPNMVKNPIYDIMHQLPLRIHPKSRYQFMPTEFAVKTMWQIAITQPINDIYNICGDGLISLEEVSRMVNLPLDTRLINEDQQPRIININNSKVAALTQIPSTLDTIRNYIGLT